MTTLTISCDRCGKGESVSRRGTGGIEELGHMDEILWRRLNRKGWFPEWWIEGRGGRANTPLLCPKCLRKERGRKSR